MGMLCYLGGIYVNAVRRTVVGIVVLVGTKDVTRSKIKALGDTVGETRR